MTPGLVGLCVPTIAKLPATFVPTIMKIKDNVVVKRHWKDLLCCHYFHRLLDISPIGLKIVKNDLDKYGWVILDFNVDKVNVQGISEKVILPFQHQEWRKGLH